MGHSRRKRPTSGATLVRYRLARRWNPISSPSFDYQAGIPGCDGLAGVSPQHAAQASLWTGSRLHHIPAQARAAPPNGRKMGHDPSLTIEKWVISGENDPLVGRRLYDNAGPTAHARLAVMPFISSRQTPAATGFSAPVSSALRPFIARRCFVSLHVVSDRCAPAERPNNGSTSVPIRPNMGRSRRGRPVDGALPGRHRRARRWIRLPSYPYDFQPTNPEGEEVSEPTTTQPSRERFSGPPQCVTGHLRPELVRRATQRWAQPPLPEWKNGSFRATEAH